MNFIKKFLKKEIVEEKEMEQSSPLIRDIHALPPIDMKSSLMLNMILLKDNFSIKDAESNGYIRVESIDAGFKGLIFRDNESLVKFFSKTENFYRERNYIQFKMLSDSEKKFDKFVVENFEQKLSTEDEGRIITEKILATGKKMGASDIKLNWNSKDVDIIYKVSGISQTGISLPHEIGDSVRTVLITKAKASDKKNSEVKGKIEFEVEGKIQGYRLSIIPTVSGGSIVLRILEDVNHDLKLTDLGFSHKHAKMINSLKNTREGLVLVTGATGSGKTTTLYTALLQIYSETKRWVNTAEDPVEIKIDGFSQSETLESGDEEAKLSFFDIVKGMLRQAPDIVLVGEARDTQTARACLDASLTGHLTFTTLHSQSVHAAFQRLRNIDVDIDLVKDSLKMVLSQSLQPKLCDNCKIELDKEEIEQYKDYLFSEKPSACGRCEHQENCSLYNKYSPVKLNGQFYKSNEKGCHICSKTPGYQGYVLVYEIGYKSDDHISCEKTGINQIFMEDIAKEKLSSGELGIKEFMKLAKSGI